MFANRDEAGIQLAIKLLDDPLFKPIDRNDCLVLSLFGGGVVVGAAVAQALGCAHEVLMVKKISFLHRAELVLAAVAENDVVILDQQMLRYLHDIGRYLDQAIIRTKAKIASEVETFRHGKIINLQAKTVLLIDDGIVTGEAMKAAIKWATSSKRADQPEQVIAAAPVCSPKAAKELSKLVRLVCLTTSENVWTVDQFYGEGKKPGDEEVVSMLTAGARSQARHAKE